MKRREFLTTTMGAGIGSTLWWSSGRVAAQSQAASANPAKMTMKFAPHFGMFRHHAGDDLIAQIDFMADEGFTAFEDNGMRGRDPDTQKKIGAALARHGMEMGVFVANDGGFGPPILTDGDAAKREQFLANIRESIEVAKRVNTRFATTLLGTVHQRLDPGFQTANCVTALRQAAELCEPEGLILVCEPLNWRDHPGLFLERTDQAYEIMRAVDSPSVKILFDIYHQQISEGNLIPNIERAWDEIAYFQIGDNPGRKEPGTGEIHYANVFQRIHDKGFRGIMGMEHGNSQAGKEGERKVIDAYRQCQPRI